jgi:membrane protease YdiL (CAAX protease family)
VSTPPERATARLLWFVGLTYAMSWAWWIPLTMSDTDVAPAQGWPTHLPGLAAPAVAAFLVTAAAEGKAGLRELMSRVLRYRVGWRWYGLIAGTAALSLLPLLTTTDHRIEEVFEYSGAPIAGIWIVVYVLLLNGFGEEIGWRGFLAERLLATHSVGRTALLVWPIWALWHLPLFWVTTNFMELRGPGAIGWVVGIGFGSVMLTWLYDRASHSILVVALWHTAYNFTTATEASAGTTAALVTAAVILGSVVVMRRPATWVAPDATATGNARS